MSLTPDQIKRELTRFSFDPFYRGENRVPIGTLARLAGLSRQHIRDIVFGERNMGNKVLTALSPLIEKIMDGRLRFARVNRTWEICETPKPDYAGAGQEAQRAAKIIPLPKPQLLERIRQRT
jgi:hypothetical protein